MKLSSSDLKAFLDMNTNPTPVKRARQISRYFLTIAFMMIAGFACADKLSASESLRIGFHRPSFHEYSREDLEISVKILTEEMGREIGIQTTVFMYDDIKLMRADFEQGKINLVFSSPLLIANKFDNTLLTDGFKLVPSGGNIDTLVVLTRKNEGMDNFSSLRGKKLGLIENDPATDLYVNFLSRSSFHRDSQDIFKEIPREKKSHQAILKLFFGQVDVICVYENYYEITAELNPQIFAKTQIIAHISGILQSAGFFHKNVDPAFRERVIAEVIKLNTYARGRQFLEIFKTEKALRVSPVELAITRQLYSNYQRLSKTK